MIYGAILAGGIGKRMENHSIPKQFITIGGTPIIVLTLREFVNNNRIDKIYIAVHKDWKGYLEELLEHSFSSDERSRFLIVNGGKQRLDSFINIMDDVIAKNGLNEEDILICHDSVRPFVRQQMINDCIELTLKDGLALTVVPTTDTIHIAHDDKFIDGTLDRNGLYNGQNPSGFNISLLKRAIEILPDEAKAKITGTTQLMLQLGYKIRIVKGHTSNFKITTDNDLDIADRMVRAKAKTRKIDLLDCTLRDGGIVLDFNFGIERMQKIKYTLENNGVEYIECGYIDAKKGTSNGRTCFDNEVSIEKTLLSTGKKPGVAYVAMIDYGTFDVNNLKFVNDTYGHIKGDELIKSVADCLQNNLSDFGKCYRIGGDEFVFISKDNDAENRFKEITASLSQSYGDLHIDDDTYMPITVAMGYYILRKDMKRSIDDAIREADSKMYENKRKIKDSINI